MSARKYTMQEVRRQRVQREAERKRLTQASRRRIRITK
jgi:hypothetical protein